MADVTIKQHDNYPYLQASLSDANGPVDLTTAVQVKFIAKGVSVTVTGTCSIIDATNGVIQYQWAAGDTGTPDDYEVEFEVTWPSAKVQTFPNDSYKSLTVMADLG